MTSSAPGVRVARFGAFELDIQTGELRKSGARIRLQDQPFRLLCALLERPGEIVTREELRGQLWPGDTVKTGGVEAYWKQRAGQPPADQRYYRARIHTAIGDHDEAFRLLGEAASRRCCNITWFYTDPAFDALRGDPRVTALLWRGQTSEA